MKALLFAALAVSYIQNNRDFLMARNTKSLRYSYKCKDASEGIFQNKNFNKTESYNSSFSKSTFLNTSLVGAKFKFCNLNGVIFENCLIQGTLFRKCPFDEVKFKNCIIISTVFDRTSLKNCVIEDSIILASSLGAGFKNSNLINSEVVKKYQDESEFNSELIQCIEQLRGNPHINRSSILHRNKDRLNTISIRKLLQQFREEDLIKKLPLLGDSINKDFYTVSYIIAMLHKIGTSDRVT